MFFMFFLLSVDTVDRCPLDLPLLLVAHSVHYIFHRTDFSFAAEQPLTCKLDGRIHPLGKSPCNHALQTFRPK